MSQCEIQTRQSPPRCYCPKTQSSTDMVRSCLSQPIQHDKLGPEIPRSVPFASGGIHREDLVPIRFEQVISLLPLQTSWIFDI
jgi:hypothetical protein